MSKMHEQEIADPQRQFKHCGNYHPDRYLELGPAHYDRRAAYDALSGHQARARSHRSNYPGSEKRNYE